MPAATLSTRKKKIWTDHELEALPKNGDKHELLDGDLITIPAHANHGVICTRLLVLLATFVQKHKLGEVFDSSTGFRLSETLLLSPDISFASRARLRKILIAPDKFLYGAPDLAVEVLSPSDRMRQVHRKLDRYFDFGTRLVWWVDWKKGHVHIYTPDSVGALTQASGVLSGGEVLPGFKCPLRRIFHPA
jgi:Uma2 family endonuclease